MIDFTVNTYEQLLSALLKSNFSFQSFSEFIQHPEQKSIILRHDVDARKLNSLHFARIQNRLGIRGSYYFRMVPQSYDEDVIKKIAELGHEVGYHYEDLDKAWEKGRGVLGKEQLFELAIEMFEENLEKLRKLVPVETICMHGSPRSKVDNRSLWMKYNYKDYGITGEPYFDIDFEKVLYLTDTGRRWDGDKVSIRDKVYNSPVAIHDISCSFHSTLDIIQAAKGEQLPDQILFTFHPQRWTNKPLHWLWELISQNVKNQVKRIMVKRLSKAN